MANLTLKQQENLIFPEIPGSKEYFLTVKETSIWGNKLFAEKCDGTNGLKSDTTKGAIPTGVLYSLVSCKIHFSTYITQGSRGTKMKNMNILTEIDTKQMNFCLKLTNKLYIDLCASVPLYEFISLSVFYRTLATYLMAVALQIKPYLFFCDTDENAENRILRKKPKAISDDEKDELIKNLADAIRRIVKRVH